MTSQSRRLVLASFSPRRRELIRALGLAVEVVASGVDEEVETGLAPEEQVAELAARKAQTVSLAHPGAAVLGADTIVVQAGIVLNKPVDEAEAEQMLRRLRGADHLVHTGLAVLTPDATARTSVTTSTVRMRQFSDAELATYLATGESLDKAGGYGIQGAAGEIVESVDGCYTNVVGLPLCAAARLLLSAGVGIEAPAPGCGFRSDRRCPCWPT